MPEDAGQMTEQAIPRLDVLRNFLTGRSRRDAPLLEKMSRALSAHEVGSRRQEGASFA